MIARIRILVAAFALVGMGACTGGINAGTQGGRAFIAFAVTLLITLGILWAVLGRDK